MKEIRLDANSMTSPQGAHQYLKAILQFPDYYGENLDALHDCLGEICEPTTIYIPAKLSEPAYLGEYGKTMQMVFMESAHENERLTVKIQ